MDYIFLPIGLVVTAGWIFWVRMADRETRRKLGGEIVEIPLYRRGAIWLQKILVGLALLMPAFAIYIGMRRGMHAGEIWIDVVRSLWLLSIVYTVRRSSKLLVGERGVGLGRLGVVEWERIRDIQWDRDIGQQQWGVSITMEQRGNVGKHRIYVHRSLRPRLERILLAPVQREDSESPGEGALPTRFASHPLPVHFGGRG